MYILIVFSVLKKNNDLIQMINIGINNIIHYLRHFFSYSSVLSEVIFGVTAGQRICSIKSLRRKTKDQSNKADSTAHALILSVLKS